MEILYADESILLCVKPAGVLSTDEPGGLPELVRRELGDERADLRTVHRLDRAVSGLMLLARNAEAASVLSRQIREGGFEKQYLAVVHGSCEERAVLRDLLLRDKARKMSFVVHAPGKGVQEAVLDYEKLWEREGLSCVRVNLHTGRTHQCSSPRGACRWSESANTVSPRTTARLRSGRGPSASYTRRRANSCASRRSRPPSGPGRFVNK